MQPQKEPPVSEAVCEVRFADGQSWDWTVPGLFYSQLKHEFPKRREQRYLKGEPVSLLFLREDERVQIQIGANALSVKHLSPYSGWEHFRAMIERALVAYLQASHPAHIQSVSLRYVYHFRAPVPLPEGGFPTLPPSIASAPQRWLHQLNSPLCQLFRNPDDSVGDHCGVKRKRATYSVGSCPHPRVQGCYFS
jgi:uncharacterized protein (TIGR04255 family)